MTTTVGVVRETAAGERRVALTPDGVQRLRALGLEVRVEAGAGEGAFLPDADYAAAGAVLDTRAKVYADSDVLVCVHPPGDVEALRPGRTLVGLLFPVTDPGLTRRLAEAKITAVSLDLLPRTLSRAQAMDALTSQAAVAGYKAALVAAAAYAGYFPMLMTAAGTTRPAQVLVLGAGVAGLQAIATSRRLGAVVTGYDIRPAAHADIASSCPTRAARARAAPARAVMPAGSPTPRRWPSGRPSTPRSPGSTSSSPPRRCPAGRRRCWCRPTRWRRCGRDRSSSTWPPAPSAATSPGRSRAAPWSPAAGSP
jgi:hypothetical protein